jgi:hypothetical protein
MARRTLTSCRRGIEGRERRVVLPRGLTDRGTHDDLEDLVLAEARFSRCGDVVVSDLGGLRGDLVDQSPQRFGEPCVVERGAALGGTRFVSFEDPRHYQPSPLFDVRHLALFLTVN